MNTRAELTRLEGLSVGRLREEYERVWGEPTRSNNRAFLVKRIVWRMQAAAEGDLSERARRRAEEIARDMDLRVRPDAGVHRAFGETTVRVRPAMPAPGAVIRRVYKGRTLEVTVLRSGVSFEGRVYSSLSALAKEITGSNWNGRLFFGLSGAEPRKERP